MLERLAGRRDRRISMIALTGMLLAIPTRPLASQVPSPNPTAQQSSPSPYPARLLDRPTTLPRGDTRFDAFVLSTRMPGSPTSVTAVLGGGVGISDQFEMGGQLVPFDIAPGIVFTNPSIYATYAFPISRTVTLAPTIQVVCPLTSDDPFTLDVGGTFDYDIGSWGNAAFAPTFSLNTRGDESGSSLSFPATLMGQASEQLSFQLSSGVGFSRFDPRFGLSRRRDPLDFNELTVPATVLVTYTVPRGFPRRALVDWTLQVQWPQLYTRGPGPRGNHTDDWTVQIGSSWYFIH